MIYFDENKMEIQGKIIDQDFGFKVARHYFEMYKKWDHIFKEQEEVNASLPYNEKYYEYYKIGLEFKFKVNNVNDQELTYDQNNFELIINEVENHFENYKSFYLVLRIQYWPNYVNGIKKDSCCYYIDFTFPRVESGTFSINTYRPGGDEVFQSDYEYLSSLTDQLPERYDHLIKNKFSISELCSLNFGLILSCILSIILTILKIETLNPLLILFISLIFAVAFGNMTVYLYINGLYKTLGYHDVDGNEVKGLKKELFFKTNEIYVKEGMVRKKAREKINRIYTFSKKSILIVLIVFIIITVLSFIIM